MEREIKPRRAASFKSKMYSLTVRVDLCSGITGHQTFHPNADVQRKIENLAAVAVFALRRIIDRVLECRHECRRFMPVKLPSPNIFFGKSANLPCTSRRWRLV